MASKWKKFKDKLPRFEIDKTWQEKIDLAKAAITESLGHNKTTLAAELDKIRAKKSALESEISELNTKQEALYQLLTDVFEDETIDSFQANGSTYFLKYEPYCTVKDRAKFFKWIKEQKMTDLLSVNFNTMNALAKSLLEEGKKLPPGIDAFIKTKIGASGSRTTTVNTKGENNGANKATATDGF